MVVGLVRLLPSSSSVVVAVAAVVAAAAVGGDKGKREFKRAGERGSGRRMDGFIPNSEGVRRACRY